MLQAIQDGTLELTVWQAVQLVRSQDRQKRRKLQKIAAISAEIREKRQREGLTEEEQAALDKEDEVLPDLPAGELVLWAVRQAQRAIR